MKTKWMLLVLFMGIFLSLHASANSSLSQPEPRKGWRFTDWEEIPLQERGRVKPLDTYARESVLFITGSRKFKGWKPSELILSFLSEPEAWHETEIIKINIPEVRRQLGLTVEKNRFSIQELTQQSHLFQYASQLNSSVSGGQPNLQSAVSKKADPKLEELKRVIDRFYLFQGLISGLNLKLLPQEGPEGWKSLAESSLIQDQALKLVKAYRLKNQNEFEKASYDLRIQVESLLSESTKKNTLRSVFFETIYNRFRPFQMAWFFYLLTALSIAFVLALPNAPKKFVRFSLSLNVVAIVFHIVGMGIRMFIANRPPVTNMFESVIWVAFGIQIFAWIIYYFQRYFIVLSVASALSAFSLILTDLAPGVLDPGIHPLQPVLRSNFWLMVHVLTITISYAAFALTFGLGNVALFLYLKKNPAHRKIENLNLLIYRAMQFGVVLLAAGTILGGIWADYSWGRFWGWDPKEVWALIALLAYVAILHARISGWIGAFSFPLWSVLGFLTVLMAWYGVNFVLGVGLHSYGFASGGQGAVLIFCLIQIFYVGFVAWKRHMLN